MNSKGSKNDGKRPNGPPVVEIREAEPQGCRNGKVEE